MLQAISDINIVLLLVFLTWHYALRCGFVSDDHSVVEKRKDIIPDSEKNPHKESFWVKLFNDSIIMYFWNRAMDKLRINRFPFVWHIMCLGLHLAICYCLYFVLLPFIGKDQALIAVLFWGVNPMLNQNIVWISGRSYLIATLFALIGLLSWHNPLIVLPFYLLGVITNISIALLPILIKLMHPNSWQGNFYIITMIVAGFPFILWKFHKRFTASLILDRENFRFKRRRVNVIAKIYGYYIRSFFVPTTMGWYHQAGFRYNPAWEKFNIWTLLSYGIVFWLCGQGWSGWWVLLGILPNTNMFATNSFVQDRYMYFGSIGISILCAPYFQQYPVLFIALAAIYASKAYSYSRYLQNDEALYRENWRNHPKSDYAVNNLAYFLIQRLRWDEARVVIHQGLEINKFNKMLWYNLGITWAAQGHFQNDEGKFKFLKALDCWKMCLQIEPRWSKPAEDLKKLIKLLVDNKVITMNLNEAMPGAPTIDMPHFGEMPT